MALLEWNDAYELGIRHLDFEHRDLFECINALHEQCTTRCGPDDVEDCIGKLQMRLAAHFALEEQNMRDLKCPTYVAHKQVHDAFLDEIGEALADFSADTPEADFAALARRVRDWIVEHITTYDRALIDLDA